MRPPQLSHNLLFAAVFCLFLPWHAEPSGETLPALNAPQSWDTTRVDTHG